MPSLQNKVIYVFGTGARKISHLPRAISEFVMDGAKVYTMMSVMGRELCDSSLSEFSIPGNTIVEGYSKQGESLPLEDLVLVAPCTFNTLNKLSRGVADTYPLTITATAIGSKRPVVIAPAMNRALWEHPVTSESLQRLQQWGCKVVWPEVTSEKVTMAPIGKIADSVYHELGVLRYDSEQLETDPRFQRLIVENHTEFREIGESLLDNDLTRGKAGCISKRVSGGILVSSTGSQVGNLSQDEISLMRYGGGKKIIWQGKYRPSSESPLLVDIYGAFPDVNAIIHGHCPRITYDPKMSRYSTQEYIRSGLFSQNTEVIDSLGRNNGFAILRLHGEVSTGVSLGDALEKLKQRLGEAHE